MKKYLIKKPTNKSSDAEDATHILILNTKWDIIN